MDFQKFSKKSADRAPNESSSPDLHLAHDDDTATEAAVRFLVD